MSAMNARAQTGLPTPNTYELPEPVQSMAGLMDYLRPIRKQLLEHRMFHSVRSLDDIRAFMKIHVFAVWDFMSLVKRLQADFAGAACPWMPPQDRELARFVNEVVLTEESDLDHTGAPMSHLEMYLNAMNELGVSTVPFERFLRKVEGEGIASAVTSLPPAVGQFVGENLWCARYGAPIEVAASFLLGREDVIPDMFTRILEQWSVSPNDAPGLHHYLSRHVQLDGEEHGPLARRALVRLAGNDSQCWQRATHQAVRALRARIVLWDAVCDSLPVPLL